VYEKSGVRKKYHKPPVAFIRALHIAPATCTLLTLSLQSREGFIIEKPSAQPIDLSSKIRTIPTSAGVYLYKNAEGEVIYVGKAKNLRSRVSSYFHEGRWEDAKTGTLIFSSYVFHRELFHRLPFPLLRLFDPV
jgi:GIY-YIG catalytic domain